MKSDRAKILAEKILAGDRRALARAVTLVENRASSARDLLLALFPKSGSASIVGITGAPGSGKSTLVDGLAMALRQENKKVAILAVDPSSPYSGGAVLGDRIRMVHAAEDEGIYIRSIATRGALGGLSAAATDIVHMLDAAGFDYILVETVGVGQAEVDIVRLADTCLVVLVPGMGDGVQAIKAGVIEIADVFVVNKSDAAGADLVVKDIRTVLSLVPAEEGQWVPTICKTIAHQQEGIAPVLTAMEDHNTWLCSSVAGREKRKILMRETILKRVQQLTLEKVLENKKLESLTTSCLQRKETPVRAAELLLKEAL